jgi:hypothetical protein
MSTAYREDTYSRDDRNCQADRDVGIDFDSGAFKSLREVPDEAGAVVDDRRHRQTFHGLL